MPDTYYEIIINEIIKVIVYFTTERNTLKKFVVKLLYYHHSYWKEISRYDTYHGYVHRDDFDFKGNKVKTKRYPLMDIKSGLNMAIEDYTFNYADYLWRLLYEKDKK